MAQTRHLYLWVRKKLCYVSAACIPCIFFFQARLMDGYQLGEWGTATCGVATCGVSSPHLMFAFVAAAVGAVVSEHARHPSSSAQEYSHLALEKLHALAKVVAPYRNE